MQTLIEDYLWCEDIVLDNKELLLDCRDIEQFLVLNITDPEPIADYGSFTSANHKKYNLFNFHTPELNNLYKALQSTIIPKIPKDHYMIQCWLNVFRRGQFIDWHAHWPAEHKVIHGYYCVNVGDSITSYKFPNGAGTEVANRDGLLVFGKSEDDLHRSSEWTDEKVPRVTIAFDILPIWNIKETVFSRHYIPI